MENALPKEVKCEIKGKHYCHLENCPNDIDYSPNTEESWETQITEIMKDCHPAQYGMIIKIIKSLLHSEREKGRQEVLKDMRKVMREWHGTGIAMVDDYVARTVKK